MYMKYQKSKKYTLGPCESVIGLEGLDYYWIGLLSLCVIQQCFNVVVKAIKLLCTVYCWVWV